MPDEHQKCALHKVERLAGLGSFLAGCTTQHPRPSIFTPPPHSVTCASTRCFSWLPHGLGGRSCYSPGCAGAGFPGSSELMVCISSQLCHQERQVSSSSIYTTEIGECHHQPPPPPCPGELVVQHSVALHWLYPSGRGDNRGSGGRKPTALEWQRSKFKALLPSDSWWATVGDSSSSHSLQRWFIEISS